MVTALLHAFLPAHAALFSRCSGKPSSTIHKRTWHQPRRALEASNMECLPAAHVARNHASEDVRRGSHSAWSGARIFGPWAKLVVQVLLFKFGLKLQALNSECGCLGAGLVLFVLSPPFLALARLGLTFDCPLSFQPNTRRMD